MTTKGIHIGKVSLRLRGATTHGARQRAASIAREIAHAVVAESAQLPPGKTDNSRLSVRLRAAGATPNLGEQIRSQWSRK